MLSDVSSRQFRRAGAKCIFINLLWEICCFLFIFGIKLQNKTFAKKIPPKDIFGIWGREKLDLGTNPPFLTPNSSFA